MRPALVLVDMQRDFLGARGLEPPAGETAARAARLLEAWRARGLPVVHAWTTVREAGEGGAPDDRMPHRRREGSRLCAEGTPGHAPPPALAPREGEAVVHKRFFGAFGGRTKEGATLAEVLGGPAPLVIAGVHLHACVRETALEAYERGHEVAIALDATASDDPVHAAACARWLGGRAAALLSCEEVLASLEGSDHRWAEAKAARRRSASEEAARASARAAAALEAWRGVRLEERRALLERVAEAVERRAEALAEAVVGDVAKPITLARAEVARTAALARAAARFAHAPLEGAAGAGARYRRAPHGVVAVVTPWNNPLAIALGKIAPAILLGNAVAWKPSPLARASTGALASALAEAGLPEGLVALLEGGEEEGRALLEDGRVDAVTLTGSPAAGRAAQEACGRRSIPLHAELGGNNAAIVWEGADVEAAARLVAEGAFGFAGQRCTANRRVVVAAPLLERFEEALARATASLGGGDPRDPATLVGPLVSAAAKRRVAAIVERARASGASVRVPRLEGAPGEAWLAPAIVRAEDRSSEIVQEESFGPVLVVQRAESFEGALSLVNGVRQGLAAALFGGSAAERARFVEGARAGIVKLDRATADASAEAPFGGWKASGAGGAEHGVGSVEVFTRLQAVYEG